MKHPQYVRRGTVRAVMDLETGKLVPAEQTEADIDINYIYSHYYYEATDGDIRFAHEKVSAYLADGTQGPVETEYGIRGLYGSTPTESIPMLMDMIEKIKNKYTNDRGEWLETERTSMVYYKKGKEIPEKYLTEAILHNDYDKEKEIKYMMNEGSKANYWEATAANAIEPLQDMIVMATDNLMEKDVVWSGD